MTETVHRHDLMDPALIRDPFAGFTRIRREGRLAKGHLPGVDGEVWLVTGHEDITDLLSDRRFVNDPASVPGVHIPDLRAQAALAQGVPADHLDYVARSVLDSDGERHARLRRMVSRIFTARRTAVLRPRVQEICDDLLAALPGHARNGVVDLDEHFSYLLPIAVICELVGVPVEDRPRWRDWGRALTSMDVSVVGTVVQEMVASLRGLVALRRADPRDDLLSDLIRVQDEDGGRLSEKEMITLVLTLVTAGHETTALLLGNGTVALLTHPEQLAAVRADPSLMPGVVDELLRWCSSILAARVRYAAEDVEFRGLTIRRGEAVIPVLVAANHDERAFPDPGRLDVTRPRGGHVGFGHGLHYCLGAALARQEAEIAFTALLARFPELALAVPASRLRRLPLPLTWRLAALPVRLGRPA